MMAHSRRHEQRMDIVNYLKDVYKVANTMYDSLSVYNSLSAAIHLYMIQALL